MRQLEGSPSLLIASMSTKLTFQRDGYCRDRKAIDSEDFLAQKEVYQSEGKKRHSLCEAKDGISSKMTTQIQSQS